MRPISDEDLEGINDTLAAAGRDGAKLGILPAGLLHQICCEVQAWRRNAATNEFYDPSRCDIVDEWK